MENRLHLEKLHIGHDFPRTLPQERQGDDLIEKFKEMWFLPNMAGRESKVLGFTWGRRCFSQAPQWMFGASSSLCCVLPCLEVRPFSLLHFSCPSFIAPCRKALPRPRQSHHQDYRCSCSEEVLTTKNGCIGAYPHAAIQVSHFINMFAMWRWSVSSKGRSSDRFYLYVLINQREALGTFLGVHKLHRITRRITTCLLK